MASLSMRRTRHRQAGVAAIEFCLTLLILLMLIFGLVSYGALFWAQQSLTGVAADTARYGLLQSHTGSRADVADKSRTYACDTARQTAVLRAFGTLQVCDAESGFVRVELQHPSPGAESALHCPAGQPCLTVRLTLEVNTWPLLNTMRSFAGMLTSTPAAWIPAELRARAVVVIAPGDAEE